MGDRQSVEALQWLAYIVRMWNSVTHAGNGREVHLPRVQNVKVDGYCSETLSLGTSGVFGIGVFAYLIGTNPSATVMKYC